MKNPIKEQQTPQAICESLNNSFKLVKENRDLKTTLNHELEVHKEFIALQERETKLVESNKELLAALGGLMKWYDAASSYDNGSIEWVHAKTAINNAKNLIVMERILIDIKKDRDRLLKELLAALKLAQHQIECSILGTPTGEDREILTDLNIKILTVINNAKNL